MRPPVQLLEVLGQMVQLLQPERELVTKRWSLRECLWMLRRH